MVLLVVNQSDDEDTVRRGIFPNRLDTTVLNGKCGRVKTGDGCPDQIETRQMAPAIHLAPKSEPSCEICLHGFNALLIETARQGAYTTTVGGLYDTFGKTDMGADVCADGRRWTDLSMTSADNDGMFVLERDRPRRLLFLPRRERARDLPPGLGPSGLRVFG